MKIKLILLALYSTAGLHGVAQTNPAITEWLQNNTVMGRHYVQGNSTPIQDNVLANVQSVQYSSSWVYVTTNGIPAYVTGPFLDGNPSLATDQNAIFKFPLNPTQNTGTTISFMDIRTLHTGNYILQFSIGTTKLVAQQISIQ